MNTKIPLVLVVGFLGSGKTSFLANYLSVFSEKQKIAIVQNEFAQLNIDSEVLREKDQHFVLRELDKGSIFCACLFSSFKDTLAELSTRDDLDVVLIEATGIADPIAIAQVMEDERINQRFYLQKIISIVDSFRFTNALENILGVRHQIEVADYILVNKTDLMAPEQVQKVKERIQTLNPFAEILLTSHGQFDPEALTVRENQDLVSAKMTGPLTRCGQGNYVSKIFKAHAVSMDKVKQLLDSLDADILRLKGYVTDEKGDGYMIQYVPGQTEIIPCQHKVGVTELISIGFKEPNFGVLE